MTKRPLDDRFDAGIADRIYDALAEERNRLAVRYFREHDSDVASLSDLARYVAGGEDRSDDSSTDRIEIRLHHCGLPRMTDAGVLEYDPRSRTVRRRDHPVYEAAALGDLLAVA